jgi:ammonium transporter, Amt family
MDVDDLAFWMFQYAFSAASTTIVAGTLAERCQMAAYLCYSVVLAGFVYPVIAHTIWSPFGFLNALNEDPLFGVGVVDFAGGLVVHVTGGVTALFATIILGPRCGRFHDEQGRKLDKPQEFPGHSIALQVSIIGWRPGCFPHFAAPFFLIHVPIQMLGTLTLWFGWYGFNSGSALIAPSPDQARLAALAATNTTLAGGMAGLCALFLNYFLLERLTGEPILDLKVAMNGSLAGLVAITAGAGVVEPWAAIVTGAVGGALYLGGTNLLIKYRLDDAVDAIPVHMLNGIWGAIAVGLFASKRFLELTYGKEMDHIGFFNSFSNGGADGRLLAANCVGVVWVCFWVFGIMMPFFIWLDWKGWFRSDPLEEIVGLDTSYHGGLILSGGDDGVNPEYITQFRKQRSELRNRRQGRHSNTFPMEGHIESGEDGEDDPETDADK